MALTLTMVLTIGNYRTTYAHSIEVESSWRELGDVATIELPNLSGRLEQAFQVGDPVEIQLGYNGQNVPVFEGYISRISPKIPFVLECEDGIFHAKRTLINSGSGLSYKSISLPDLITEITGSDILLGDIPQVTLSPYRLEAGVTVAKALDKLKEDYLLVAYYRGDQLFVGLPYTEFNGSDNDDDIAAGRYAAYSLNGPRANVIEDDLTWKRADDMKLQARAVSILPDNSRIEVTVGDQDGERRSLFFRNIRSKTELEALATAELTRLKYDGYEGSIETFGIPRVIHGATASLSDIRYPERSGNYLVDKVTTSWGTNGYRRKVQLGPSV